MSKPMYFNPQAFIDEAIKDMKLGKVPGPIMLGLRNFIEKRLGDRILTTVIENFGDKEMKLYERLLIDHQELDDLDVLMMIAPEIPGIQEKLERAINSLYFELTREADEVEESIQAAQQTQS